MRAFVEINLLSCFHMWRIYGFRLRRTLLAQVDGQQNNEGTGSLSTSSLPSSCFDSAEPCCLKLIVSTTYRAICKNSL